MAGSSTKCPFMGGVGLRGFDCILILLFVVYGGNGYETWQSSLLYAFVGCFGFGPVKNLAIFKWWF